MNTAIKIAVVSILVIFAIAGVVSLSRADSHKKSEMNREEQILFTQKLLQRFSFLTISPTQTLNKDVKEAIKGFYRKEFNKTHSGEWEISVLKDLMDRRLITMPQIGETIYAEESLNLSEFSFDMNFKSALNKKNFVVNDFGFTAVKSSEKGDPFCYPSPKDCIDNKRIFSPNPHNAVTGDFNGDGFQDLAIAWVYFTHTMPRSQTPSHIRIYLNNGNGKIISTPSIYKNGKMPLRHMLYRMTVNDFNGDGVDDIFAGSMGVIKRIKNTGSITDFEPHVLLLSDGNGKLVDSSKLIEGQEDGGLAVGASFSHTSSSGDIDCDGDYDIYSGGILFLNNGEGRFLNKKDVLPRQLGVMANPPKGASVIADINRDGCGDLITFDFSGNGHIWQSVNGKNNIRNLADLKINHQYGKNNMQVNNAVAGDINRDGMIDVIAAIHRKDPYYLGRRITILKNISGKLQDMSKDLIVDERDLDNKKFAQAHGEGSLSLMDYDRDGDLDIIDSFGGSMKGDDRLGMTIFENSGKGQFTQVPQSDLIVLTEQMIDGFKPNRTTLSYGYPLNIDDEGMIDYVSFTQAPYSDDYSTFIGYSVLGK